MATDTDTGGGATQADASTATAPLEGTPDAQAGDGQAGGDTVTADDARKLRSEAKNLRDRAKNAEAELEKLKAAQMSDSERRDRDLDSTRTEKQRLEKENRSLRVQVAAVKVGVRADAVDAAAALLDWDTVDDPSDAKAIERALKALVKERPFLSGVTNAADAGASGGEQANVVDMNQLLRRAAGRAS